MNLINKIKKFFHVPILYSEYITNPDLTLKDLSTEEYLSIRQEFNDILKQYNLNVSEEDKLKHLSKQLNVFDYYFPDRNHKDRISFFENKDNFYEVCLEYYFNHLDELRGKCFNFFKDYLRKKIHERVTDRQLIRYLNGDIKFEEIKTYWEELEELRHDANSYIIGHDSAGNPIFDEICNQTINH